MSLVDLVAAVGVEQSDAEIVAAASVDVPLAYNTERWTYAGVASRFGPEAAEGLSQAMTAAGLTTAVIAYATVGFDLSLDITQAQLDAIAGAVPQLADACNALKLIGRPTAKRYTQFGLDALPSESDIAAVRPRLAFAAWATGVIQLLQAAKNGEQTDIASYKEQIAKS